jgi:4-hydroxybenzoate polyprenyltransferase
MSAPLPLCVDCDGTLLRTDLLHEAVLVLLKQAPWLLLLLPFWALRGKAHLKARVAQTTALDWARLPLRQSVVDRISLARREGRIVVLATAAHEQHAQALAAQWNWFDEVVASSGSVNLSGAAKADALIARYGLRGFDYIGDSRVDLAVWAAAHTALVVGSPKLAARATTVALQVESIEVPAPMLVALVQAMRPHQWVKNLLVFVPLVAAHALGSVTSLCQAALAFVGFGLCASAAYLINDLVDLEADRRHASKRRRPFASGRLSVAVGMLAAPLLLAAASAVAWQLPPAFMLTLALYFVLTTAYSLRLKRQVVVDVIMLAGLYTLRIIAGAAATEIVPSFWLLAFAMFVFLSLALVKRYTELRQQEAAGELSASGRGYWVSDLPVLLATGSASSLVAVLVFALFVNAPSTISEYHDPRWLWLVPPVLLYWCLRVWMKAHRGELHDDPVVFALRDWQSLASLAICAALFFCARWL